jgi:hypothetical protein
MPKVWFTREEYANPNTNFLHKTGHPPTGLEKPKKRTLQANLEIEKDAMIPTRPAPP